MTRITKGVLFGILLSVFCSAAVEAQTIDAASCNASDVQAALNQVNADGTTVIIPACPAGVSWTSSVAYTQVYSTTILGAGSPTGYNAQGSPTGYNDQTVFIDNVGKTGGCASVQSASSDCTLNIITAAGKSFRLSGITVTAGTHTANSAVVKISGTSQQVRIDHNHFVNLGAAQVLIDGDHIFGVLDHNQFEMTAAHQGIWFWQSNWDGYSNGDGSWIDPTNLGSSQFFFAENNTFNGTGTGDNDCTRAGRYVWRYNTMNNGTAIQTHPTGGSGRARGCRAWEIYNNDFVGSSSTPQFNAYFLSSGTGVIWGNSAPVGYERFVSAHNVRSDNADYSQTATPNGWGYCGTAFNGSESAWDGNTSATTGYPCLDQVGRGAGQLLNGSSPNVVNTTTGTIAWPNQALEPVYEWMDTWAPVPGYGYSFWGTSEGSSVIVNNRDYYLWCNASSPTGCASSFNGTQGTGSGLLSARPATCTHMVAYWATDTNTLYQCSSPNTWTAYYTPYTYPHPLTVSDPQAGPAPPTSLQATPH